MKRWTVAWTDEAIVNLQNIHWETGSRIDEAVQRFATTGEGLRRVVLGGVVDSQNFNTIDNYCGITHIDAAGAPVASFAGGAEQTARNSLPVGVLVQSGGAIAVLSVQTGLVDYARYNADNGAAVDVTPKTVAIPGVHRSNVGAAGLVVLSDESTVAPFNGPAGLYLLKLDVHGNPVATFGTAGLGGP